MKFEIYSDGSYSSIMPDIVSSGIVILCNDMPIMCITANTKIKPLVQMNNVGGELLAPYIALGALASVAGNNDTVIIYHDYKGVAEYISGKYKPNKPGTIWYKKAMMPFVQLFGHRLKFEKVAAHTGVKWNELADHLAKGHCPAEYRTMYRVMEV